MLNAKITTIEIWSFFICACTEILDTVFQKYAAQFISPKV